MSTGRAWLARLRRFLTNLFGRKHKTAVPDERTSDPFSYISRLEKDAEGVGRDVVMRLAVTQGSRLVLVFQEGAGAAPEGVSQQRAVEANFVQPYRVRVMERRVGREAPPGAHEQLRR
jgi:hypothetical protein